MAWIIDESFRGDAWDARLAWFNEPPAWSLGAGGLTIRTAAPTDFWQRTHYGFRADSGHVLGASLPAGVDWEMTAQVRFAPVHQYDQAGLIVRFSADCWLKTSVEFEPDEPCRLGAVVTNGGWSDWSTQDFDRERREVWLRIARRSGAYWVHGSHDGQAWHQLRLAPLEADGGAPVAGVYACSPKGEGFEATFAQVRIVANA